MVSSLTQSDVARLLAEPAAYARAEVAAKLAAEIDSPRLTDAELKLAQDIVGVLAKDVEATVRAALSQSLRGAARLPRHVALRLANDIETVALPLLSYSPVLTNQDLIEIVKRGSEIKQIAIAGRPNISDEVSETLIAEAGEKPVAALLDNATARISETSLGKAIDRFKGSEAVKTNMVKRASLPAAIAERLVALVSEQLKAYLVSHHELPPALAADLVLQSRERSILELNSGRDAPDAEKLVAQMHANKRLTSSIVLRALCMGDLAFFEAAVAVLADVPLFNARILIHDTGRLGLKSLYVKSGLPPRLLPAVRVAIEVARETPAKDGGSSHASYRARVTERILTHYQNSGAEDLGYLLENLGDIFKKAA